MAGEMKTLNQPPPPITKTTNQIKQNKNLENFLSWQTCPTRNIKGSSPSG